MDKLNDQHYINLVMNGDTNAFAALVDRHKDFVFTLSLKILQNREEAEEAAQDTFIKIYKSLNRFKGESKFSTWIYKITYNNCLDRLKKQKRKRPVVAINEYTEHEVKSLMNVLDTIEENERQQMIKSCLDLLPAEESFLLTLYYFNENSLKEIAQIMSINENNVKIKLYRSRKKLTGILKTKLEPEIIDQYEKQGR
ncbi:MAG TPA: sigma-70 family RNA polymerase sigma factor [Hanamia sp.]|nr:sigma-70 family RNA polymerase sigma factor [Hanamia sp.]